LVLLLFVVACSSPREDRSEVLERALAAAARRTTDERIADGSLAFSSFRRIIAETAEGLGDADLAQSVRALEPDRPVGAKRADLASRLLRAWVVARYHDAIVRDLREMIGFRTYHVEGRDNWDAPEFLRQRAWLESRAAALGLEFRSVDGRVEEITLPAGERVLGILTHGDVQDVRGQEWTQPPWEGRLEAGRIYGRGSEDDKGPIATTLYVFAALRDSGWPLDATLRLIVANGEECCWDEIPYYLERQSPPDVTLGFDASYPVTHAQKAWCRITLTAAPDPEGYGVRDVATDGAWYVESMQGGDGLSIIPERGQAMLYRRDSDDAAIQELRRAAEAWAAAHPPARLVVEADGEFARVTAIGRGGHSSTPEVGRNALGDLTAFLRHATSPVGSTGALAHALGSWVGMETDGESLSLAHHDAVMGALTVNLAYLEQHDGGPGTRLTLRVPRGLELETIERQVAQRAAEFEARHAIPLTTEVYMPVGPHFVPVDGPLVETLLEVWETVTGEPGVPVAIGGGTQARLFPDGVDFGPALAMERYRGHGPDEYMTVDEIRRNAELTVAAVWALAGR
jgi:dipeptidase D